MFKLSFVLKSKGRLSKFFEHESRNLTWNETSFFLKSNNKTGFRIKSNYLSTLSSDYSLHSSSVNFLVTKASPISPCGRNNNNWTKFGIGNQYSLIDQTREYGKSSPSADKLLPEELSPRVYEEIADDSLESLYTYFDEILEKSPEIVDGDVSFGTGVLTIKLGQNGTYVINKQTPNQQIWFSSPTSGPKRYDFIKRTWIYKHDGVSLYQLLNSEIPQLLGRTDVDFEKNCHYGKPTE